jgi:hypothetical protein
MCLAALLGALVGTKTNSDFAGLAGLPPRTANRRAMPKGPGGADAARVIVWVEPAAAAATSLSSLRNAEKVLLTWRCAGGKLCNCATVVTGVGAERCSIFTAR